jgi:xylulokinase
MFVPHLGGRNSPSWPHLRGSWSGLAWNHSAGHLYRAILEGVTLEYCIYRDVLRELNPEMVIREVRVTGGGERSSLWNQIKADALGVPLTRVTRHEGAPLGAALVAGFGAGLFSGLDETAADWIQTSPPVNCREQLSAHYAERLQRYKRLLDLLHRW